ncbi:MAG: hypothetical protein ACLSX5_07825 [Lachnospiraceae bacterium]
MKKKMKLAVLTAAAALSMSVTAWAGEWKSNEKGWWYELDNGDYATGFMVEIDGKWYSFGENGYMVTGWLPYQEEWYYMNADGSRASGWKQIDGNWYYFNEKNGFMLRSEWKVQNGKKYYFHEDGKMAMGYFEPAVKKEDRDIGWYFADPADAGAIKTSEIDDEQGLKYDGSGRIYVREGGSWVQMATVQDRVDIAMEEIEETYLSGISGTSQEYRERRIEEMEKEAKKRLGPFMTREHLEAFTEDMASRISFQ